MLRNRYNICKKDYETLVHKKFRQYGGNIFLETRDSMNTFNIEWKNISNSGQHNCGIFLNKNDATKIVKCVEGDMEQSNNLTQSINKIAGFHIFPEIHSYFNFLDNPNPSQRFIEMERFDGDVTDLLMHILPKMCISLMNLDENDAKDLIQIFEYKLPSTIQDPRLGLRFYFTPIIRHIIKNLNEHGVPDTQEDLARIAQKEDIKLDSWIKINDIQNTVKTFRSFVTKFSTSKLTSKIYNDFINLYITVLNKYIPMINEQMFVLRYRLLETGHVYKDDKFDNFAFTFADQNTEYMNIRWGERNKIGDKYFFLHILDWESGLFKHDPSSQYEKERILKNYIQDEAISMSVHGQYTMHKLNQRVTGLENSDLFLNHGVSAEVLKILSTEINYTVIPENKPNFETLEDAMKFIESKNPKPLIFYDVISKHLGKEFTVNDVDVHSIVLIKNGSSRNNFTEIKYIEDTGEYMIICLDDSKEIAKETRLWPKGQITTRDIHQVVRIVNAIYE